MVTPILFPPQQYLSNDIFERLSQPTNRLQVCALFAPLQKCAQSHELDIAYPSFQSIRVRRMRAGAKLSQKEKILIGLECRFVVQSS